MLGIMLRLSNIGRDMVMLKFIAELVTFVGMLAMIWAWVFILTAMAM